MAKREADKVEYQKRIYAVSLLLRRKPTSFIIQFITEKWNISDRQARNYIRKARAEWKKYFEKLKGDGIAYHVTQNRDLKDKAMTDGDYKLAFDIAKEEAKLMGVYPAEKHDVNIKGELEVNSKLDKKLALLDINELKKLSKRNIKANAIKK